MMHDRGVGGEDGDFSALVRTPNRGLQNQTFRPRTASAPPSHRRRPLMQRLLFRRRYRGRRSGRPRRWRRGRGCIVNWSSHGPTPGMPRRERRRPRPQRHRWAALRGELSATCDWRVLSVVVTGPLCVAGHRKRLRAFERLCRRPSAEQTLQKARSIDISLRRHFRRGSG